MDTSLRVVGESAANRELQTQVGRCRSVSDNVYGDNLGRGVAEEL